jgi:DNA polymerase III subunit delta'
MTWDMLGHEWAADLLRQHVAQASTRHAYLFTGPQGVGRRTLAIHLVQALNCPQPIAPGVPCRTCQTCTRLERMQHPDLSVVQAEQVGGTLKVEQVRELQHSLSLSPYAARYRVALLLRFEEAHASAANALLKTLEEPPPQVVLIVTAQDAESLLPTIVSRCEVLRLRPLPLEILEQGLQARWGLDLEQARLLAHLSGGRPGYALSLAQDRSRLDQRQHWLDDHRRLLEADRVERLAYSESHSKEREQLRHILMIWLSLWRDVLLRASGASAPVTNLDRDAEIQDLATKVGLRSASGVVSALQRTIDLIDRNVNARLALDVFMLDLPQTTASSSV